MSIRKIIHLVFTVALVLALTGCGNKKESGINSYENISDENGGTQSEEVMTRKIIGK